MPDKLSKLIKHYKYGFMGMLINIIIMSIYIATICYLIYCYLCYNAHWFVKSLLILSTLIITSITTIAILLSPKGYELTDTELILTRLYKPIHIPLKNITFICMVDIKELRGTVRLLGSSGFYGYWGKFKNSQYGIFYMHVRKKQNMLYIRCNNGKQYIFQGDEQITKERILNSIKLFNNHPLEK